MTALKNHTNQNAWYEGRVLCWAARIISSLAAAIWALIMAVILFCDAIVGCVMITVETGLLVFFAVVSAGCVFFAWRQEFYGGLAMILWGVVFTIIAYVTSSPYQVFSILVSGAPFVIAGILFLAGWWRSRSSV